MSVARSILKLSQGFLRPKNYNVVPLNQLRTTAQNNAWYHMFIDPPPEYDKDGREKGFPTLYDLSTNMLRQEYDYRLAGNMDPYDLLPIEVDVNAGMGTKETPVLVNSPFESRIVTCHCNPEYDIGYSMWIHQGEPVRCKCGLWLLLYYEECLFIDKVPSCE